MIDFAHVVKNCVKLCKIYNIRNGPPLLLLTQEQHKHLVAMADRTEPPKIASLSSLVG